MVRSTSMCYQLDAQLVQKHPCLKDPIFTVVVLTGKSTETLSRGIRRLTYSNIIGLKLNHRKEIVS